MARLNDEIKQAQDDFEVDFSNLAEPIAEALGEPRLAHSFNAEDPRFFAALIMQAVIIHPDSLLVGITNPIQTLDLALEIFQKNLPHLDAIAKGRSPQIPDFEGREEEMKKINESLDTWNDLLLRLITRFLKEDA